MESTVNKENYLWIITQAAQGEMETFMGLTDEQGEQFIPATASKEEALVLMGRLPRPDGKQTEVEAIHRVRLLEEAGNQGFVVYKVDRDGRILERLTPTNTH